MEYVNLRDLRILVHLAAKGRASYQELVRYGSIGGVYGSLSRLITIGFVRKIDRGEYEITEKGREALEAVRKWLCGNAQR